MYTPALDRLDPADRPAFYAELAEQTAALLRGERDRIANAANLAALLWLTLPDINWAGFYFVDGDELVLGPFQGQPACTRIAIGKGVCGTAALTRQVQRIDNVHEFPGHIACDSASQSELVLPLIQAGNVIGVLDIDSPRLVRFSAADQAGLEVISRLFVASLGDE